MKTSKTLRGFTLIEVLVALAVFSSVVSIALFGLEQGRAQWFKSQSQNQATFYLFKRKQWLEQALTQANSAPFIVEYGVSAPHFFGTASQLDFLTNAPILSGPGTYAAARLRLVDSEGKTALVFTQWVNSDPYYGIPENETSTNTMILISGLENARWDYYLEPRIEATPLEIRYNTFTPRQEGKWASQFDARYELTLPQKVRLSFQLNGKSYHWFFNLAPFSAATGQEEKLVVQ